MALDERRTRGKKALMQTKGTPEGRVTKRQNNGRIFKQIRMVPAGGIEPTA